MSSIYIQLHAIFVILACFVLVDSPVYCQELAGKVVNTIEYRPTHQPIDPRDLERMMLVEVGQPLNPRQVAATLDRLYSTGLYDDLQVDARQSGNGVVVTFITRARRFIGHVGAQGHISDPPSRGIIISDAQMNLGTPFDEAALVTARRSIEQELRRNGLFESKADVVTITDPETNQVTIRFLVDSGPRAKYDTPVITGDTKLSDSTIIRAT